MEVLPSALRHGIDVPDIDHAIKHPLLAEDVGEDPLRILVLGPDRAGNPLELVLIDRPVGLVVIHAMRMRPSYKRLLAKGSQ